MTFFFISKVLPFRDLRISLSFKGRISFLKTFANLIVAFLNLCFSSDVVIYIFFVFPSLHAFSPRLAYSQSRTQPSTHNSSVHTLAQHATRAAGLLASPNQGGEDGALLGAFRWRR